MTYKDFIDELKPLIEQAESLFDREELDNDQEFRKWKLRTSDILRKIEKEGYKIRCGIEYRAFRETGYHPFPKENIHLIAYNRELQDTINELELIVANYEKYGTPKSINSDITKDLKKELQWPDKITIHWLYKHAPYPFWLKVIAYSAFIFLLGLGVKKIPIIEKLLKN